MGPQAVSTSGVISESVAEKYYSPSLWRSARIFLIFIAALVLFLWNQQGVYGRQPSRLVPRTVAENSELPARTICVGGVTRRIHFREFGDPRGTPVLIMHGSLSDMRAYLPLGQAIATDHHVIMWDLRGNGLSERVPANELRFDLMVEEIEAVRLSFLEPDEQIILLGHSWSAAFAALYSGRYPGNLNGLVLLEPPGLKGEYQDLVGGALHLMSPGYLEMVYLAETIGPADHERSDFRALAMLRSGVRDFFVDHDNPPPWPVWRVGGVAIGTWERSIVGLGGFRHDFTTQLRRYHGPALIVGSDHSPIGYEFQRAYNAREFVDARVRLLADSGHRMVTEQFDTLLSIIRGFMREIEGE